MLDINLIRSEPDFVKDGMRKVGEDPAVIDRVLDLDVRWRAAVTESEELKAERNRGSKSIPKMEKGDERDALIARMRTLGDRVKELDAESAALRAAARRPDAPHPQHPARGRAGRRRRERERRAAHGGGAAAVRLRAEAALGPRPGARHPGLRPRRQAQRLALLRAPARGRPAPARPHQLHARHAHAPPRLHARSTRRTSSAASAWSAPATCRSSPTTSTATPRRTSG